jgi:hypothetical protein
VDDVSLEATRYWHRLPSIVAKTCLSEEIAHRLIYTSVLDVGILENMELDVSDWFEDVAKDIIFNFAVAAYQSRIVFMLQTRWDNARQFDVASKKAPARGFCFEEIQAGFVAVVGVPRGTRR